ncbi:MAG: LptF/LptG family permease [Planctomycetota bacterium]
MPTRLSRYILAEILKIFVVSLIVLTALILVIGVGRELVRQGLGVVAVVQLLPFVLPLSLQFAFPATALFSVCSVYGRMAADGEIATLKASGISPLRALVPALVFATLLSPVAVFVSDLAVSWGRPGVNRVVLLSITDIAYRVLDNQHSYTSDHGFSIHVRDIQGKRLIHPTVTIEGSRGNIQLTAREGELTLDPDQEQLLLRVVDSHVEGDGTLEVTMGGETTFPIPLGSLRRNDPSRVSPSELPLRLVSSESIRQERAIQSSVGVVAVRTGLAILSARPEDICGGVGRTHATQLHNARKRLRRLHIVPWRRWAEGFSCFAFVLVGAPLAMLVRSGDSWTTFGLCFLPTLIVYYPLFMFGLEQAKDGHMPPQAVWIGNFVLITIATMLIAKVRRH